MILVIVTGMMLQSNAATYSLGDGSTIEGIPISFNKDGVVFKTSSGAFLPRTPWNKLSESALRLLQAEAKGPPSQDTAFITPYLSSPETENTTASEWKEIDPKQPSKVEIPSGRIGFWTSFTSPVGLLILFVVYLANLYAAYEITLYRRLPLVLSCCIAAVVPIAGPVALLCIPLRMFNFQEDPNEIEESSGKPTPPANADSPAGFPTIHPSSAMSPSLDAPPLGLNMPGATQPAQSSSLPPSVTFKRGEFVFNRRFFETKLADFLKVIPSEKEKDFVLRVKSARGEFTAKRITKITPADYTLLTFKGDATAEETIPFPETYEIEIRHKDAV